MKEGAAPLKHPHASSTLFAGTGAHTPDVPFVSSCVYVFALGVMRAVLYVISPELPPICIKDHGVVNGSASWCADLRPNLRAARTERPYMCQLSLCTRIWPCQWRYISRRRALGAEHIAAMDELESDADGGPEARVAGRWAHVCDS